MTQRVRPNIFSNKNDRSPKGVGGQIKQYSSVDFNQGQNNNRIGTQTSLSHSNLNIEQEIPEQQYKQVSFDVSFSHQISNPQYMQKPKGIFQNSDNQSISELLNQKNQQIFVTPNNNNEAKEQINQPLNQKQISPRAQSNGHVYNNHQYQNNSNQKYGGVKPNNENGYILSGQRYSSFITQDYSDPLQYNYRTQKKSSQQSPRVSLQLNQIQIKNQISSTIQPHSATQLDPSQNNGQIKSWYSQLDQRAVDLKDALKIRKDQLNHIIDTYNKFNTESEALLSKIQNSKEKCKQGQSTFNRKYFEDELNYDVEYLQSNIELLRELYKEDRGLKTIQSLTQDMVQSANNNSSELGIKINPSNQLIYQQQTDIDLESYDFQKLSKNLLNELDVQIKNMDIGINEYKKYYKVDQGGEEFNIRAQNLLKLIKNCEQCDKNNQPKISLISKYISENYQKSLSHAEDEIQYYSKIYNSIESSFNLVIKLIYIRKNKIPEIKDFISQILKNLQNIQYPFNLPMNRETNMDIFKNTDAAIKELFSKIHQMKKEIKNMALNAECQYFLQIKFKQSQKNLHFLRAIKQELLSIQQFARYLREGLELEDDKSQLLHQKAKNLLTEIAKIDDEMMQDATPETLKKLRNFAQIINIIQSELSQHITVVTSSQSTNSYKICERLQQKMLDNMKLNKKKLEQSQNEILQKIKIGLNYKDLVKFRKEKESINAAMQNAIDYLNKIKSNSQIFFNFQDAEQNSQNVMQTLGKIRKAKNKLESVLSLPHLESKLKQERETYKEILILDENLEILSTIFENSQYLNIENFSKMTFEIEDNEGHVSQQLDQLNEVLTDAIKNNIEKSKNVKQQADLYFINGAKQVAAAIQPLLQLINFWKQKGKELVNQITIIKQQEGMINSQDSQDNQQHNYKLFEKNINIFIINDLECAIMELVEQINQLSDIYVEIKQIMQMKVKDFASCLLYYSFCGIKQPITRQNCQIIYENLYNAFNQVFNDLIFQFTLRDLILYQSEQKEILIQDNLQLLRSRMTDALQNEDNLNILINHPDIISNIKLDLLKYNILQDSITQPKETLHVLIDSGIELNSRLREAYNIKQQIEQLWNFSICIDINSAFTFIQIAQKYLLFVQKFKQNKIMLQDNIILLGDKLGIIMQTLINKNTALLEQALMIKQFNLDQNLLGMTQFIESQLYIQQTLIHSQFDWIDKQFEVNRVIKNIELCHQNLQTILTGSFYRTYLDSMSHNFQLQQQGQIMLGDQCIGIFKVIKGIQNFKTLEPDLNLWLQIIKIALKYMKSQSSNEKKMFEKDMNSLHQLNNTHTNFINAFINFNN